MSLSRWLAEEAAAAGAAFAGVVSVECIVSGEAFHTPPGPFTEVVAEAVRQVAGRDPELSTTGGTSDARFIRALCPVIELGLVGTTMHMVDERAPVQEIRDLAQIYRALIDRYFERFA